jgi:uncharacterized protein (DUF2147 family)
VIFRTFLALSLAILAAPAPALAEPALGVWRTEPDGKGQIALVEAAECGGALCGTITQVLNATGQVIDHRNVGKRIFWDMRMASPGVYEGRAFVPAFGAEYDAKMTLGGDKMKVGGCLGPICKSQTWTRVR